MHKSAAVTFGVLITSLGILGVTPLFNQNNNNNAAMAQEYDNSYGDSYYSHYPTDDKKYECRTGPFEGFFVSSVEFCDAKHDKKDKERDRDDNRTGTQGPPGPQGPPGINVINESNAYIITGIPVNSSNSINNQGRATATCDPGDTVIEGMHFVLNDNNNNYVIPLMNLGNSVDANFADTYIIDIKGNNIIFRAQALCFDNPPAHIP